MPETPYATSLQLKADIDSGKTGDKVAVFDPSVAPLGTDEEAAGTSTPPAAIAETRTEELRIGRLALGTPRSAASTLRHALTVLIALVIVAIALWYASR